MSAANDHVECVIEAAVYETAAPVAPDGYSFIPAEEVRGPGPDEFRSLLRERVERWRPAMTWFRVTTTMGEFARPPYPEGVWIEVWTVRPIREAAFNPPLVAA